ncbi:MAG: isochorismatase family cysteine hydrolase [Peptostreptococcaceae bacterium]
MKTELNILNENLKNLETINNLDLSKTQLFIVDINNGFCKNGNLYSKRLEDLINPIVTFVESVHNDINKITAFTDHHTKDSIELLSYPDHCLDDTIECEIVDELKVFDKIEVVKKNSTNGFFALKDFSFEGIENIVIIGDCTNICVYQLAITLKTYFNENNISKEIIVPMDLVDTYHIDEIHPAEFLNTIFLNSMIQNGVKVVKKIEMA